jgi:hypothetical protein
MAMTVNPDADLSAPDTFRPEGLYAFRFDLTGNMREEVTFKVRLGDVRHDDRDGGSHRQGLRVLRAIRQPLHALIAHDGDDGGVVGSRLWWSRS